MPPSPSRLWQFRQPKRLKLAFASYTADARCGTPALPFKKVPMSAFCLASSANVGCFAGSAVPLKHPAVGLSARAFNDDAFTGAALARSIAWQLTQPLLANNFSPRPAHSPGLVSSPFGAAGTSGVNLSSAMRAR